MSINKRILLKVQQNVPILKAKKQFSTALYTGGVDVKAWKTLTADQKEAAIKKDWYVRWHYRSPETGKMTRQQNIKAGVNYFKTKEQRMEILTQLENNLIDLLKSGLDPYAPDLEHDENEPLTVNQAFDLALEIKKSVLSVDSYPNFKNRIDRFREWLKSKGYVTRFVSVLTKKIVNDYLNIILKKTTPRNRNNTRLDLSSLFAVLKAQDIIAENFIKDIEPLKTKPERNKSFTTDQEENLFLYIKDNNPDLYLYILFISYNFLRPAEVSRLLVKDINIKDKTLSVKTKTGYKIKIIPDILLSEIPDLGNRSPDDLLFTGSAANKERDRRSNYGKQFLDVKNHFKLSKDYGMYSFRHTFISKLYNKLIKEMSPDESEGYLMSVTGHSTRDALRKYLRSIDAYRPEDYSKHLR